MKNRSTAHQHIRSRHNHSRLLTRLSSLLPPDEILALRHDFAGQLSAVIKTIFWPNLVRSLDGEGISKAFEDSKMDIDSPHRYLYVPPSNETAQKHYEQLAALRPDLGLKVVRLSEHLTPAYVHSLKAQPGVLALALEKGLDGELQSIPYVVPGGRFNECFGWDSYFIALGLIADGQIGLARGLLQNLVSEVQSYGRVLNANRTYFLTRSQPPFLTAFAERVFAASSQDASDLQLLQEALRAAIAEYTSTWNASDHVTTTGLARYFGRGLGVPPETEPGHFDALFRPFAEALGISIREVEHRYENRGELPSSLRAEIDLAFEHDRAVRESGHDTSRRLVGKAAQLATVDLNSLLFRLESDLARLIDRYCQGSIIDWNGTAHRSEEWKERANMRRELMNSYLWDQKRGGYFDYNLRTQSREAFDSVTTFFPLWAGVASAEQAQLLVTKMLPLFEVDGGLVSTTESSRGVVTAERPQCQWDYPFGWAPHQMLIWEGLSAYGFQQEAQRLAYKWLHLITKEAARSNGKVVEKYDVVEGTMDREAEYGNVGSGLDDEVPAGFGWTNASFQCGLAYLSPSQRQALS